MHPQGHPLVQRDPTHTNHSAGNPNTIGGRRRCRVHSQSRRTVPAQSWQTIPVQSWRQQAVARARNCHGAYGEAGPRVRRLMSQAFFKKVWVKEEGVVAWEFNEPFATLLRAHRVPEPVVVETCESSEVDDRFEGRTGSRDVLQEKPRPLDRGFHLCCFEREQLGGEGGI